MSCRSTGYAPVTETLETAHALYRSARGFLDSVGWGRPGCSGRGLFFGSKSLDRQPAVPESTPCKGLGLGKSLRRERVRRSQGGNGDCARIKLPAHGVKQRGQP
jgi:hypothetical protein